MNALALTISDISIRQDDQGRYCLNDLHKAAGNENKHRPSLWLKNQQTIELIAEIEKAGIPAIQSKQQLGTFCVKELVYAYGMWISALFSLKVIRAYDALVTARLLNNTAQLPEPPTLSKAQIGILYNRVAEIASGSGTIRAQLWSRFQNHFKLSSYKDLPANRYEEALTYLDAKQTEYLGGPVNMLYLSSADLEAKVQERVKAIEGELLSKPEPSPSQYSAPASLWDLQNKIGCSGWLTYPEYCRVEPGERPLAKILKALKQDGHDIEGAVIEYNAIKLLMESFYYKMDTLKGVFEALDRRGLNITQTCP